NAIISASRRDMLGSTLYLTGRDARNGALLTDTTCCSMCRRLVINAGIKKVVVRNSPADYTITPVQDWIDQDDTIPEEAGCKG
ncbi:MAG: cytidine deaminase, partial [Oscillospiraceae bacterium]|nr:cytidine deaminase [Oscillospiraceae bacterium]